MPDAEWYEEMASAMKERDRCINAVAKWQGNLADVEARIQRLRESDVSDVVSAPDKFDDVTIPAANFQAPESQLDSE